jgi:ATP-dependent DNA ligase
LELKLDGYSGIGIKPTVARITHRATGRISATDSRIVPRALNRLPDETAIDGEIVALNEDRLAVVQPCCRPSAEPSTRIVFHAFDLLMLSGTDLPSRPLEWRRAAARINLRHR